MPTVARLCVTPVKSLQLLHPVEVRLEPQGIPGNRLFFLVDGQRRLFGDAQYGPLVRVVPSYAADTEWLELRLPDGSIAAGDASVLGAAIETNFWGRVVPGHLVEGPWSEFLSRFVGATVRLVRCDRPGDGNDEAHVTLVARESVAELARLGGHAGPLDPGRFRMNLELEGCSPHEEDTWEGRLVRIGGAAVRIHGKVPRCVITTQSSTTGLKDFETLTVIASYRETMREGGRGLPFGMYAEVEEPGAVRAGDPVVPL